MLVALSHKHNTLTQIIAMKWSPHLVSLSIVGLLVAFALGCIFGALICDHRGSLIVEYKFVPNTITIDNPWGKIHSIETYYLRNGFRVPHGERVTFDYKTGGCRVDTLKDGKEAGSRGGMSGLLPYTSSPNAE